MKLTIAVTSQNKKDITQHAGGCRKFWIYKIEHKKVVSKELLEMPKGQNLKFIVHGPADMNKNHELFEVDAFLTGGMGGGLYNFLRMRDIAPIVTTETNPDKAIKDLINGTLAMGEMGGHHHHNHEH